MYTKSLLLLVLGSAIIDAAAPPKRLQKLHEISSTRQTKNQQLQHNNRQETTAYGLDGRGIYGSDVSGHYVADNSGLYSNDERGKYSGDTSGIYHDDGVQGRWQPDERGLYRHVANGNDARGLYQGDSSGWYQQDARGLYEGRNEVVHGEQREKQHKNIVKTVAAPRKQENVRKAPTKQVVINKPQLVTVKPKKEISKYTTYTTRSTPKEKSRQTNTKNQKSSSLKVVKPQKQQSVRAKQEKVVPTVKTLKSKQLLVHGSVVSPVRKHSTPVKHSG